MLPVLSGRSDVNGRAMGLQALSHSPKPVSSRLTQRIFAYGLVGTRAP